MVVKHYFVNTFIRSLLAAQIRVRRYFFARSIASEVGEALLERIGIPAWMTFKVISVGILPLEYTIH